MTTPLIPSARAIVAAPMAGGPTTVALATAVATAGGFPFLAAGYRTSAAVYAETEQLRARRIPFGVNLFVPSHQPVDETVFAAYAHDLQPEADRYGLRLDPHPRIDDDGWSDKIRMLLAHPVPIVSFTFGLPPADDIAAVKRCGSRVVLTVTNPDEAQAAAERGADGLVVQALAAGGHSATFDPATIPKPVEIATLVAQVRAVTTLPLIAAGGIDSAEAVGVVREAGAEAAAVGTLLLRTDEAGTSPVVRAALADPDYGHTVITRAFTGRPARALPNGFVIRHPDAPTGYPAVHHLTRPIRGAAFAAGDSDRVNLWAGTGWRNAPTGPAGVVIRALSPDR